MYSHSYKHNTFVPLRILPTLIRRKMFKKTTPEVTTFVDGRPNFKLERKDKSKDSVN